MEVQGFNLDLCDFCRYCSEFEVQVDKEEIFPIKAEGKKTYTIIRCKNRSKCDAIVAGLKERLQK